MEERGGSKGVRDAVERDLAVRERGGGEEKSDGDSCAIVLDAVERRRGNEVKRRERGALRLWRRGRASRCRPPKLTKYNCNGVCFFPTGTNKFFFIQMKFSVWQWTDLRPQEMMNQT